MQCFWSFLSVSRWLLLVFSIIIVQVNAICELSADNQIKCASFQDIIASGNQGQWEKVQINNPGGQQLQTLEENFLINIPNVKELQLNGVVKSIGFNAFKSLRHLEKLQLFNNDLPEIKNGMFTNIPAVELLIYTSKIRTLKPRSFDNLHNLSSVYLHKNSISKIPAGVFSYTKIEVLYLNENGIETIEEGAFFGMDRLKKLALERNFLNSFDAKIYVGNTSPDLTLLWLARNNLTQISKDSYTVFPKLQVLLLHINKINKVEYGSFNGVPDLRYLDLSNNEIQSLHHKIFPWEGLEFMDTLFLQNNRLTFLAKEVIMKLPRLKSITLGGNPWKCPCYKKIGKYLGEMNIKVLCDEEYFEGRRPVCIRPKTRPSACLPNLENAQEIYEIFDTAKLDYPKLPPLCKIYCEDKKPCYSHDFDVLQYS